MILAFVSIVAVANAWDKHADEGIIILATKHLSPEAKVMVEKYLGTSYADDVKYLNILERKKAAMFTKEIHYLHLDKDFRPMKIEGDDALAAIEKSMAVVRARDSHSKAEVVGALRTIINLMCDIHNPSYVRIENIPHSQQDFIFFTHVADMTKRSQIASKMKWSLFWDLYAVWHAGFSGALWAEDMELCHGGERAKLSKGSLQDWAAQIGANAAELYARIAPDYHMTRRERNELEDLNCEMMSRAGYRLAALFNELAK